MMKRYLSFVATLAIIIAVAYAGPLFRMDEHAEVIKFSHKFHAEVGAGDCATCHTAASVSASSKDNLIAKKQACAGCHDVENTDECAKCHYEDRMETFPNPDRELIFSHQQHVAADLACETCHKGVNEVAYASNANMPDMASCNTCHNGNTASAVCESCHTDFVNLLPADHKFSDFKKNHRQLTRLGAMEVSCQTCHTESTCQGCHQGVGLQSFGKGDITPDPRPVRTTRDNEKKTVVERIHELNYKFTHAIDAKSRQNECATCHSEPQFCVACHQEGGNINQAKFKPASHAVPGFTTLGRGSGGGEHARMAKRDIEECMACHNVEGRDPTCMLCHTESGRVR